MGALYSLQDGFRPRLNSQDKSLDWWDGGPAFVLASAGAVRLSFRALIVYPPTARLRDLGLVGGWHGVPCNISAWALCSSSVGQVMPWRAPETTQDSAKGIRVDGWTDLACTKSEGKFLVSKGVYDISACDILDEGLDVVYYSASGTVFHRHSSLPLWKYWTLVALSIALVRFLSHNIQLIWGGDKSGQKQEVKDQIPALVCAFAVLVIILADGDSMYVTLADQVFFWGTAGYILVYLLVHVWKYYWRTAVEEREDPLNTPTPELQPYERPVYNIIVATLQLVAMRFYTAAETPYNLVLLGMLAARGWYAPKYLVFFSRVRPPPTRQDNP